MKLPQTPPELQAVLSKSGDDKYTTLMFLLNSGLGPYDIKGRYLHWDKLRHLSPPEGYDAETYWLALRQARQKIAAQLPFKDKNGQPFFYGKPDGVIRDVLWISENATGAIQADARIVDPKIKNSYLINSIIEEAINSSQLEGASTTRRVAKEMIRTGRAPQNHSEKMILNNHWAMLFIREHKDEYLTPSLIFALHRILTEGTLAVEDELKAGALRDGTDDICVFSQDDVLLHVPPKAVELKQRLQLICDFANDDKQDDGQFIPPVIRAIIIHFMIGYDHPFVDGNGRTARALFYWMMAKKNYWLMEYISISRVIKKAPAKYMQAFLYTETDANDVTYFIVHQLEMVKEAIKDLHLWLAEKTAQLRETERALENSPLQGELNHRQLAIIKYALNNPGAECTIKSHQTSHGITYETARTDLLMLSDKFQILKKYKSGKMDIFIAPPDIREKIKAYKKQAQQ
jgi:Fic family protein